MSLGRCVQSDEAYGNFQGLSLGSVQRRMVGGVLLGYSLGVVARVVVFRVFAAGKLVELYTLLPR